MSSGGLSATHVTVIDEMSHSERIAGMSVLASAGIVCLVLVGGLYLYSQVELQVGYATITVQDNSRLPVSSALFSSRNEQDVLVWEAGIEAVQPIAEGRVLVDQQGGTRTGIALVNPQAVSVSVTLTLRDTSGVEVDNGDLILSPGEYLSKFVDEEPLFPDLPVNFRGSLNFRTGDPTDSIAALTLRQNTNLQGEAVFATLPVVDLSVPDTTDPLVFPQLGAGEGLATQIILINGSDQFTSGLIQLFDDEGVPLEVELDGETGSEFGYEIEGNGTFQGELTRESGVAVGYAVVSLDQGIRTPSGSVMFQFRSGSSVLSEAGVGAIAPTTAARIFVDNAATRTGVALASPGNPETVLTVTLLGRNGLELATTSLQIPTQGHIALFADELFPDLVIEGFTGLLELVSSHPVAPITLKLTNNSRGQPVLTTLPVADLTRDPDASPLVLPQLGFGAFEGGEFSTRLILVNGDLGASVSGSVDFFQPNGLPLMVPLPDEVVSRADYQIASGGGSQLRPGNVAAAVQVVVDPVGGGSEVVVNVGGVASLSPRVIDTQGKVRDDFELTFLSLSPDVASVDSLGRVQGNTAGFATVTVSAGNVLASTTVVVVLVTPGPSGFTANAVVQDLARRLYLTDSVNHRILVADDLGTNPQPYAGVDGNAGFKDDERLKSLFRNPAYLAFDQAQGSLYVSDGANHAIRLVAPGPGGTTETLAGSGEAGSSDGVGVGAAFDTPQGVVLDNRGNLWVADSGNHTVRRINLIDRSVTTIAGQAGSPGLEDGLGPQARFNSPLGIALEVEPLAQRLAREQRGETPPPVSVLVADTGNGRIRRVVEDGTVETLGGAEVAPTLTGVLQAATSPLVFDLPTGVAVDPFGNIYVTEPRVGRGEDHFAGWNRDLGRANSNIFPAQECGSCSHRTGGDLRWVAGGWRNQLWFTHDFRGGPERGG